MSARDLVHPHPDGSALITWVVPGARRTEVVGFYGDALRIRIAASPEKGRANKALVKLLGDQLGAKVRLATGATSRRKRFVVEGVEPDDLVDRIERLVD